MNESILRTNRDVYDRMATAGDPLCRPATKEELARPLEFVDSVGWLGKSIAGMRTLCLAAGGGRQSAMYAAAGAKVTVVDLSGAMLELDRQAAAEHGFEIRVLQTSMDDLAGLQDGEFDLVIHPVSTCYVPTVEPVYREIARVTRPGGLYISQHKQPINLQASYARRNGEFTLRHSYYETHPVPPPETQTHASGRLREQGALEFVHRWQELIGTLCRSGFVIEDLTEPLHAKPNAVADSFADRATYIPPYVRLKARRVAGGVTSSQTPSIIL
ncbi:MAG: class I SAM-dependent methyltransferase [Planctomycetota bacterium]